MKIFFLPLLIAVEYTRQIDRSQHDGAFIFGPIAAIIAFIVAYLMLRAH